MKRSVPLLCSLALLASTANAAPATAINLEKIFCGLFKMEGTLHKSTAHPGSLELHVDEGTLSERRIVLGIPGKMDPEDQALMDGVAIRGQVLLLHSCLGDCYGILVRPEGLLNPTEPIRGFAATMAASRIEPAKCIPEAQARKRVIQ